MIFDIEKIVIDLVRKTTQGWWRRLLGISPPLSYDNIEIHYSPDFAWVLRYLPPCLKARERADSLLFVASGVSEWYQRAFLILFDPNDKIFLIRVACRPETHCYSTLSSAEWIEPGQPLAEQVQATYQTLKDNPRLSSLKPCGVIIIDYQPRFLSVPIKAKILLARTLA